MLLCLDIGNSHIFGGVFDGDKLSLRFRHATYNSITSDQIGIFLKDALLENNIDPQEIKKIAICSVVPSIDYSFKAACIKYFKIKPFIVNHTVKKGFEIKTKNPAENGADIIAGIIAATKIHPKKNLIIIDLGTITTLATITKNNEYLGSTFIPGIQTAMKSFQTSAASLFPVEIIKPKNIVGRSTAESLQAGLYWGHLGAIKEMISQITAETFPKEPPILIATGGFAHIFKNENIFNHSEPDLVLKGIKTALEMNQND